MLEIRQLKQEEFDFLLDMHYESVHMVEDKPTREELLGTPSMKKYHENWGKRGDRALVAVDGGKAVGAAWYRLFSKANPGYGYLDENTPELGIAIRPDGQQKGVGTLLMNQLIEQARADGYPALSLSVDPETLGL
ncbi:GNAT family N-acetyltransferase [Paenibacillus hexagrammi]|uniref:GNAT family N-acetyltransferase n=1 Tax=Paenibacillus hexagrammi TaxID=2908839 RepID=A0ABY3SM69_9BACL|nr:GNAT family N-acetyltransferase [Paenibacillus sp. YPD9-1]UJF34625.1 GNAT family N-acetyltransferase [Paenibacillus sp. YPD9-1]